jgi:IMP cyclohydrolase
MNATALMALAGNNILALAENPYPGRGIVAGLDESGLYMVQVYWIMGRKPNSRNRVFDADDNGRLFTEAADPSKVEDPSLIIYNAMREKGLNYVVSNGDQTDTVISSLIPSTFSLDLALRGREYEPDKPNFTPRITAINSIAKGRTELFMSLLRKSLFGEGCDRFTYELTPAPGFGYCITTYTGDGDPLPPFAGEPVLMPLVGGIKKIANDYWAALNEENRVSLAVKSIQISSGNSSIHIINKYAKF